jgi:hypothetical protein
MHDSEHDPSSDDLDIEVSALPQRHAVGKRPAVTQGVWASVQSPRGRAARLVFTGCILVLAMALLVGSLPSMRQAVVALLRAPTPVPIAMHIPTPSPPRCRRCRLRLSIPHRHRLHRWHSEPCRKTARPAPHPRRLGLTDSLASALLPCGCLSFRGLMPRCILLAKEVIPSTGGQPVSSSRSDPTIVVR